MGRGRGGVGGRGDHGGRPRALRRRLRGRAARRPGDAPLRGRPAGRGGPARAQRHPFAGDVRARRAAAAGRARDRPRGGLGVPRGVAAVAQLRRRLPAAGADGGGAALARAGGQRPAPGGLRRLPRGMGRAGHDPRRAPALVRGAAFVRAGGRVLPPLRRGDGRDGRARRRSRHGGAAGHARPLLPGPVHQGRDDGGIHRPGAAGVAGVDDHPLQRCLSQRPSAGDGGAAGPPASRRAHRRRGRGPRARPRRGDYVVFVPAPAAAAAP
jgi:hypothetical protein